MHTSFSLPRFFMQEDGLPPCDPNHRLRSSAYNWSHVVPVHHTTTRPPQRSIVRRRPPLTTVVYHDSLWLVHIILTRRQTIIKILACTYATRLIGVTIKSLIKTRRQSFYYRDAYKTIFHVILSPRTVVMCGRRDFTAVLMTTLALLMLTGTRGQPTVDPSASRETIASDHSSAAEINSIDPAATAFSRPFNGSAESLKKVRITVYDT